MKPTILSPGTTAGEPTKIIAPTPSYTATPGSVQRSAPAPQPNREAPGVRVTAARAVAAPSGASEFGDPAGIWLG